VSRNRSLKVEGGLAVDVGPPDVPDRGLLTCHSRCLGSYALFVFLGRVSRANVSARAPCAKSSTSRATRWAAVWAVVWAAASGGRGGATRLEELEKDEDAAEDAAAVAGGDGIARDGGGGGRASGQVGITRRISRPGAPSK
jgi:hypothetical protein